MTGSKERACRLPLMDYLSEKMCALCYERAWYAKLGGCIAIKFLFERMDLRWVLERQFNFLKALLFVMMDLTGEVSNGAVDMAKVNLEKMLKHCASPLDPTGYDDSSYQELINIQNKSLYDVTHELVRQVRLLVYLFYNTVPSAKVTNKKPLYKLIIDLL